MHSTDKYEQIVLQPEVFQAVLTLLQPYRHTNSEPGLVILKCDSLVDKPVGKVKYTRLAENRPIHIIEVPDRVKNALRNAKICTRNTALELPLCMYRQIKSIGPLAEQQIESALESYRTSAPEQSINAFRKIFTESEIGLLTKVYLNGRHSLTLSQPKDLETLQGLRFSRWKFIYTSDDWIHLDATGCKVIASLLDSEYD